MKFESQTRNGPSFGAPRVAQATRAVQRLLRQIFLHAPRRITGR